mmetsp:Transcript_28339/g.25034  ORF Transcript_28339/g.25034 Transcript_28339/m.25034 type:complete len:241 (-) Transcript_28339:340-1062(-)
MVATSLKSIVSFISRVLSIFACCSCDANKSHYRQPLCDANNSSSTSSSINKELKVSHDKIVNGYLSQFTSSINTNEYFCGSIPKSVMDLCCLYYKFCNTFILNTNNYYLNLSSNPKSQTNDDNNNKFIEYFSKPFNINNGFVFRNMINIEYNQYINKYETCYYLQLVSLPKDIVNITIDYELSSSQIDIDWKNIVTLSVGDIVGSPSTLNSKESIINLPQNNVGFSCDVKLLLKNGKSIC